MPAQTARQQHPLNHALASDTNLDMVALTVSHDGRTGYKTIDARTVVTGTDITPYLPREIWREPSIRDSSRTSHHNASVDCSQHGYTCTVCLDSLKDGDVVSRFWCNHVIHFNCANEWLSSRILAGQAGTCPMW